MAGVRDAVDAGAVLTRELGRVARLHDARRADPTLAHALARLGEWQSRRLFNTYADLAAEPRYAGAIAFFQLRRTVTRWREERETDPGHGAAAVAQA